MKQLSAALPGPTVMTRIRLALVAFALGLALLVTEGPLHRMAAGDREGIEERLLDMVEKGL